jgi:hypothetical protein
MPSLAPALDHSNDPPLYSKAELIELRRYILLYARSFPPGFERNQHRQIALSLGRLFHDAKWLDAHTRESSIGEQPEQTIMGETHRATPSLTEHAGV